MAEQKFLSRQDFLEGDLKKEAVEILGGVVYVRQLSSAQLLAFNNKVMELHQAGIRDVTPELAVDLMAYIVTLSACDEEGNLLFTAEDTKKLAERNLGVLTVLSTKALTLSGLDTEITGRLSSEVAANLKNDRKTSSSSNSRKSYRKQKQKS